MSERVHISSLPISAPGFSLVELLTAMALSLLLFAMTFSLVQQLDNTADVVGSAADVNENVRAAINMVSRDLSTAGQNIPVGGIPLPYGGTATAIKLPYPTTSNFPTPASGSTLFIPVLTAGNGLGPAQGSGTNQISTDVVTMIGVNQTSNFNPTTVSTTSPHQPTISSTAATITVSATAAGYVSAGQLIMLTNNNSSCLLAISSVNTSTGVITFTHGDTTNDLLGVNQFPTVSGTTGAITSGPLYGTILQLETATVNAGKTTYAWPTTLTAYPISVITYYLDSSSPIKNLTKLTSMGTSGCAAVSCTNVIALGINVFQVFYSLSPPATQNGVTNDPTENPWPTTTDTGNTPNHIVKVVLNIAGETNHKNFANSQWYSREIKNAVTIQNLDYVNKYGTSSSSTTMTQN
jgi:type II secretory pathway pseudopilin PulG